MAAGAEQRVVLVVLSSGTDSQKHHLIPREAFPLSLEAYRPQVQNDNSRSWQANAPYLSFGVE